MDGSVIVGMVCGLVFLAIGLAHYAGFVKPLAFGGPFGPYLGLGAAWIGGAVLLSSVARRLDAGGHDVLTVIVAFPALLAFAVGVMGIAWLPRFLRPRWLRDWVDHGKPDEEARKWPRLGRREGRGTR